MCHAVSDQHPPGAQGLYGHTHYCHITEEGQDEPGSPARASAEGGPQILAAAEAAFPALQQRSSQTEEPQGRGLLHAALALHSGHKLRMCALAQAPL